MSKGLRDAVEKYDIPILAQTDVEEDSELARGGFGIITLGTLKADRSKVAIKRMVLKGLNAKKDERRRRLFVKEIKILGKTAVEKHPNIVRLLGVCEEPVIVILEYMEFKLDSIEDGEIMASEKGNNLEDLLRLLHKFKRVEEVGVKEGLLRKAALEVATGLAFLHKKRIWHRDLKPSNVLATNSEKSFTFKLTDFGESRAHDVQTASDLHSTAGGVARGTQIFFAPEQLLGKIERPTDKNLERIDIWGYGLIIFCLLAPDLKFPWKKEYGRGKDAAIQEAMTNHILPKGSDRYRDLPEQTGLGQIYTSCCQYNPTYRPAMNDVVNKLTNITCSPRNTGSSASPTGAAEHDTLPIDSSDTNDGASKQPRESLASADSSSHDNSDLVEQDQNDDSSDSCDDRSEGSVEFSDSEHSDASPVSSSHDNSDLVEQDQNDEGSDSCDDTGDEPKRKRAKVEFERMPGITCKASQRTKLVATPCDGMDGMDWPWGVCVLGDHVVVGDYDDHRVRLFKRTGPHSYSEVGSLGGEGSDRDYEPRGMCTGDNGSVVYLSGSDNDNDNDNDSVKEIDIAEDGQLRVLRALTAGGRLVDPRDVCTAYNSGELLVVCYGGVHVVDVTTEDIISTLPTPTYYMGTPRGVACRDERIVVTRSESPHLLVYTAPYTHGAVHTIQGLGDPWGVVIDKHQNILVSDWNKKCIFRLDIDSNSVSRYDVPGEYGWPRFMALDGEHLLITTRHGVLRADMTQFSAP